MWLVWATFAGVQARTAHLAAVAATLMGPAVTEAQTLELESGRTAARSSATEARTEARPWR
jgi:hypothetical protein